MASMSQRGGVKAIGQHFPVRGRGKNRAVIVPLSEYRKMMEDLHDLAVVAERRSEPSISLKEMWRRLRARGIL